MAIREFGESLLADVRERKDSQARDARKYAKKQQKKELLLAGGAWLGSQLWDVGNSMIAQKTKDFLSQGPNAANIIATKNAYNGAKLATDEEAAARGYAKGYSSYFQDLAGERVRNELTAKYAEQGTAVSKTQLNNLVTAGMNTLGKQLEDAHGDRFRASQNYLETTGEEGKLAYVNALKKQQPSDLNGVFGNFIGRVTGLSGDDAVNARAEEIFGSAAEVKKYREIYQKTKNSDLASIFTKELPDKLDPAALVYGKDPVDLGVDPVTGKKILGFTVFDPTNKRTHIAEPETGTVTTGTTLRLASNFNNLVTRMPEENVQRGVDITSGLSNEIVDTWSEYISDSATDRGIPTSNGDPERIKFTAAAADRLHRQAGALAYQLGKLGVSDSRQNALVRSLLEMHISSPEAGVLDKGAGQASPFFTLAAISAVRNKEGYVVEEGIVNSLLGRDGINLFQAYKEASGKEKIAINTTWESIGGLFKGGSVDTLKQVILDADEKYGDKEDNVAWALAWQDMTASKLAAETNANIAEKKITPKSTATIKDAKQYVVAKGLDISPEYALETSGKEITAYIDNENLRQSNTENVKDFFRNFSRRNTNLSKMSEDEKKLYLKTGKLPPHLRTSSAIEE